MILVELVLIYTSILAPSTRGRMHQVPAITRELSVTWYLVYYWCTAAAAAGAGAAAATSTQISFVCSFTLDVYVCVEKQSATSSTYVRGVSCIHTAFNPSAVNVLSLCWYTMYSSTYRTASVDNVNSMHDRMFPRRKGQG